MSHGVGTATRPRARRAFPPRAEQWVRRPRRGSAQARAGSARADLAAPRPGLGPPAAGQQASACSELACALACRRYAQGVRRVTESRLHPALSADADWLVCADPRCATVLAADAEVCDECGGTRLQPLKDMPSVLCAWADTRPVAFQLRTGNA